MGKRNKHQPIVKELITILRIRKDLKEALKEAITKAACLKALTLKKYLKFLDDMVTLIPTDRNLLPYCLDFYYIIDQSELLKSDPLFREWTHKFLNDWGSFLDTPESAKGLATFYADPAYNIEDFFPAPSGWLTFNQFFAREIRPGKRPIDDPCNDKVIVAPADSVFKGSWQIDKDSEITVKGLKWKISQLLDLDPQEHPQASKELKAAFAKGVYTHSYLSAHDYHRFHVPVSGTVKYAYIIEGQVALDVVKFPDGSLDMTDGDTWQFSQVRGLVVLDSPELGYVAILPIGMGEVSSVTITAQVGAELAKGEEFGYFQFGGSDIIMLFSQKGKVSFTADIDKHYKQGQQIAKVKK